MSPDQEPRGRRAPVFGLSPLVLATGLILTMIVALLELSNERHERELTFEAAATRVEEALANAVDARVEDFDSGVNFIATTHPGTLADYQDFFTREIEILSHNDPAFVFIEPVRIGSTNLLTKREERLGNDRFSLTLLPGVGNDRLIVTRLVGETTMFELPLLGLDVTTLTKRFVTEGAGPGRVDMTVLTARELGGLLDVDDDGPAYEGYLSLLVGEVHDREGRLLGHSIYYEPVAGLLDDIATEAIDDLNVMLHVEGIEEPVAGKTMPSGTEPADAELRTIRELTAASIQWRLDVWADSDYGQPVGLLDQGNVFLVGSLATLAVYVGAVRRERTFRHLQRTRWELDHARSLAHSDHLTGLLNRGGLVDAARKLSVDTAATVFFIDLDGFKDVNDSDGHDTGDEVLRLVADQLTGIFRAEDLIGRLGGDEFVVFTEQGSSSDHVEAVTGRINAAVSSVDHRVSCSVGVVSRRAGESVDVKDLVRSADMAMYEAKRSGGDRCVISQFGQPGWSDRSTGFGRTQVQARAR